MSWSRLTQWNQTSALLRAKQRGVDRSEGKVAPNWHGGPWSSVTMETQREANGYGNKTKDIWQVDSLVAF